MTQLSEFAHMISEDILSAQQTYTSSAFVTTNGGTPTIYMPVKAALGYNLGGILVRADVALTASAANAITSGTDVVSEWLSQYEVVGGTGGPTRLQCLTRLGAEATERLLVQPSNANVTYSATNPFTYPRAAPAAFTAAGSRTDTSFLVIPASGGQAAQIRFVMPAISSTMTLITSASTSFTLYSIPTLGNAVTAVAELTAGPFPIGTVDLATQYQPDNISPLLLLFVGTTADSTHITRIIHESASSRSIIADFEDAPSLVATNQLYPAQTGCYDTTSTLINLQRQRARSLKVTLAASLSLDLLYLDIENAPTAAPTTGPSATPVPPATQTTATTGAGGTVIPSGQGGIGTGNSGPGAGGGGHGRSPPRGRFPG